MRQNRPQTYNGPGDRHLVGLSRQLLPVLRNAQRTFAFDSLRLRKSELAQLADILVEFAEDIHNEIGIWAAYEQYNLELFGVCLPFAPVAGSESGISLDRVRHLLWVLYPAFIPGQIVAPRHQDLERLAKAAHAFLAAAFRAVPRGSGITAFLRTPSRWGWEVKRKLIWLGTRSYLFRTMFRRYLDENNRGRWEIGHVDDFLCQECTAWSGLGAIDVLARVLDVSPEDRQELRGWYERHGSFYQVISVDHDSLQVLNVVNDRPYRVLVGADGHPFKPDHLIFGSMVPWRGDWYWSGEQEAWDPSAGIDLEALRDTMKRQSSHIVCRFWKEYETLVRQRAAEIHQATMAFYGRDLILYPDGLSMAADWQKELRANWEARPREHVQAAVKKHRLKRGRPDISIPEHILEHKNGIGVFINPDEGKEIFLDFNLVLAGLKRRGQGLADGEGDAIRSFIMDDAASPRFVRRVLEEYGSESVKAAFLLDEDSPGYWLDYLLRRYKGHFFRKRYPSMSVV